MAVRVPSRRRPLVVIRNPLQSANRTPTLRHIRPTIRRPPLVTLASHPPPQKKAGTARIGNQPPRQDQAVNWGSLWGADDPALRTGGTSCNPERITTRVSVSREMLGGRPAACYPECVAGHVTALWTHTRHAALASARGITPAASWLQRPDSNRRPGGYEPPELATAPPCKNVRGTACHHAASKAPGRRS